jgi:hypothetical protein
MHPRDLPLFAVQRSGSGRWLVWAPNDDPCAPAVCVVDIVREPFAAAEEKAYSTAAPQQDNVVRIRTYRSSDPKPAAVVEAGDLSLSAELLTIANLLGRLHPPDYHRPQLFHEQVGALTAQLRSLARRVRRTA